MLPPWAQIVFVGYMSRDQIHQVIAREREMLAAIEKSRPQLQLSNSRFAEQRNEIIKELEAELAYRDQNGIEIISAASRRPLTLTRLAQRSRSHELLPKNSNNSPRHMISQNNSIVISV